MYQIIERTVENGREVRLVALDDIGADDIRACVHELSGRDVLGYPSCMRTLRRTGSLYVKCGRESEYPRPGFIVQEAGVYR
jgi:hypothetical protein